MDRGRPRLDGLADLARGQAVGHLDIEHRCQITGAETADGGEEQVGLGEGVLAGTQCLVGPADHSRGLDTRVVAGKGRVDAQAVREAHERERHARGGNLGPVHGPFVPGHVEALHGDASGADDQRRTRRRQNEGPRRDQDTGEARSCSHGHASRHLASTILTDSTFPDGRPAASNTDRRTSCRVLQEQRLEARVLADGVPERVDLKGMDTE